jgi:hypothetical protein
MGQRSVGIHCPNGRYRLIGVLVPPPLLTAVHRQWRLSSTLAGRRRAQRSLALKSPDQSAQTHTRQGCGAQ